MEVMHARCTWDELIARDIHGYTILLDIDGVVMADGERTVPPIMYRYINQLKKTNDVFIVSNNIFKKRRRYVSETLGIPAVESGHRKPNAKILPIFW